MDSKIEHFTGLFSMSIIDALNKIDFSANGIMFVVDDEERLMGCLTDGDVRRWIISSGDVHGTVADAMNKTPIYLSENEYYKGEALLKEKTINAIPICDNGMRIKDVIVRVKKNNGYFEDDDTGNLNSIPVIIMAGGKGTRLYPYTKILPKPLIPIGDTPILERILDRFYIYGYQDFYLVLNYKRNMIKAYFNDNEKKYTLHYIDEDIPLGTGGGLSLLKEKIDTTFVMSNCDILIREDFNKIYDFHRKQDNFVTMVCSLKNFNIPYGVVNVGKGGNIKSMEEKPRISFFTNTGYYVVEPGIFEYIVDREFASFPDIIEKCRRDGRKIGVFPISENSWLDMGQMDSMEDMRKRLEDK